MTDKKLIQAPHVSVAALRSIAAAHEGNLTININMPMSQQVGEGVAQPEGVAIVFDDEGLLTYIEGLPPPRLRSLIERIYRLSLSKHNGNVIKAGEWLGVSPRTLRPDRRTDRDLITND